MELEYTLAAQPIDRHGHINPHEERGLIEVSSPSIYACFLRMSAELKELVAEGDAWDLTLTASKGA